MSERVRVPAGNPDGGQYASATQGVGVPQAVSARVDWNRPVEYDEFSGKHIEKPFTGSSEVEAEVFWNEQLMQQSLSKEGLFLSHESPGDQTESFKKDGLKEGFAQIGNPSEFTTGPVRTRVWFRARYADVGSITPDMQYYDEDGPGGIPQPYLNALSRVGKLRGVDVSVNTHLEPRDIARIEVIRDGVTTTTYEKDVRRK